jgi:uncharacterized protein HemY
MNLNIISKIIIIIGISLVILGFLLPYISKIPFIGRLPGDIYIERENFKFYFPLTTSIIISIIISLIIYLLKR